MAKLHTRKSGFTLVELLIAMAVIAIFAMVALPSFQNAITRGQRSSCVSDVLSMLSAAREEAVSQQQQVALCASTDQASCNTNNWESGWLMFVDDGAGGAGVAGDRNLNGDEVLLRISNGSCGNHEIRSANLADAGGIGYEPEGLVNDRGSLVICGEEKEATAAAVILNISGQPRLATDDDADGVVNQDDGAEVVCA